MEIFSVEVACYHLEESTLVLPAVKLSPKDTNASKHAAILLLKESRILFHEEFHQKSLFEAFFQSFQHLHFVIVLGPG